MELKRSYDRQFKIKAVRLVTKEGRKAIAVARDLGIHVNLIYLWKKQFIAAPHESFPGQGRLKSSDEALRKLQKELADVTKERDILKKCWLFSQRTDDEISFYRISSF